MKAPDERGRVVLLGIEKASYLLADELAKIINWSRQLVAVVDGLAGKCSQSGKGRSPIVRRDLPDLQVKHRNWEATMPAKPIFSSAPLAKRKFDTKLACIKRRSEYFFEKKLKCRRGGGRYSTRRQRETPSPSNTHVARWAVRP